VKIVRELLDLDELILADIREMLTCVGRWPPHIDRNYVCIVSQTDVLLYWL
jgi:hypothetical protein